DAPDLVGARLREPEAAVEPGDDVGDATGLFHGDDARGSSRLVDPGDGSLTRGEPQVVLRSAGDELGRLALEDGGDLAELAGGGHAADLKEPAVGEPQRVVGARRQRERWDVVELEHVFLAVGRDASDPALGGEPEVHARPGGDE